MPRSVAAWIRLSVSLGIQVQAVQGVPCSFTARLIYGERMEGGWLIAYNARGSAYHIRHWLCHELSEYLALCDTPNLFGGMSQQIYDYTGGSNPDDVRHIIARRVENLCFSER
jgi:hypothetical protein